MNTRRDLCPPSHLRQECAMSVRDDTTPVTDDQADRDDLANAGVA